LKKILICKQNIAKSTIDTKIHIFQKRNICGERLLTKNELQSLHSGSSVNKFGTRQTKNEDLMKFCSWRTDFTSDFLFDLELGAIKKILGGREGAGLDILPWFFALSRI